MNTIKWNYERTGFTLNYENGTKETYTNHPVSNVYVRIEGQTYWLVKK